MKGMCLKLRVQAFGSIRVPSSGKNGNCIYFMYAKKELVIAIISFDL